MADKTLTSGGAGIPSVLADVSNGAGTAYAPTTTIIGPSGNKADVDANGNAKTKEVRAATSVVTSPNVTTSTTSILVANANRLGVGIWNEGPAACLVKLGATASLTSYTVSIPSPGYAEIPFGWTGAIDGIVAATNAQLRVTEVSA